MTLLDHISKLRVSDKRPCDKALEWIESLGPDATMADVWAQCKDVDWMFWWMLAAGRFPPESVMTDLFVRWYKRAGYDTKHASPVHIHDMWSAAEACTDEAYDRFGSGGAAAPDAYWAEHLQCCDDIRAAWTPEEAVVR